MSTPAGNFVGLNLGPLTAWPASHTPLNLGVSWDTGTDPPDPPDPVDPVIRGLRRAARVTWRGVAPQQARTIIAGWTRASAVDVTRSLHWKGRAERVERASRSSWALAPRVIGEISISWRADMALVSRAIQPAWASLPLVRLDLALPWRQQQILHAESLSARWRAPTRDGREVSLAWRGVNPTGRAGVTARWLHPHPKRIHRAMPWSVARLLPWVVRRPVTVPPDPPPADINPDGRFIALDLGCPVVDAPGLAPLNLGVVACYAVRARSGAYIVTNEVAVVRLPDRLPIDVTDIGIRGALDAWGFTVDMTLADPAQLPLLRPSRTGPRQIEVTVNGYVWTFIVESYSSTREWLEQGVRVSGRSRTALLGAPYAPSRTHVSVVARSAAQLVDQELADTGYVADYRTIDWLVPAGAWFYESTAPLDAIGRVAEASGAVVQSHPESLTLTVRPRYPASPWEWPDVTPDHAVQDDIIVSESLDIRSAPLYDAVVVTGELQGKGVTGVIRRAGEAGTLYAPQASSPLINTSAVAAERGRVILSDRGEQAAIALTLPMFSAPVAEGTTGRVLPLDLVEVRTSDETWHGLCTAFQLDVRVTDQATVVEQTISLERHYTDAD